VIKGELKGADLDKYNATALKDWNDVALVACEHCARYLSIFTFPKTSMLGNFRVLKYVLKCRFLPKLGFLFTYRDYEFEYILHTFRILKLVLRIKRYCKILACYE
jgi:hypothetical protein